MARLRQAMRRETPSATLGYSIDGFFNPAWPAKFADIPALAAAVDLVFLMCYDSTGMWGQPHPRANANSPLFAEASGSMYGNSIAWQLNQSMAAGMPARQLVIGVPWYGREWPVFGPGTGLHEREIRLASPNVNTSIHAGTSGYGKAFSAVEARNRSARYGRKWDNSTKTPYYKYQDQWGQWALGTYDDEESLSLKYAFARDNGVGAGIWAIDWPYGDGAEWRALQVMQE